MGVPDTISLEELKLSQEPVDSPAHCNHIEEKEGLKGIEDPDLPNFDFDLDPNTDKEDQEEDENYIAAIEELKSWIDELVREGTEDTEEEKKEIKPKFASPYDCYLDTCQQLNSFRVRQELAKVDDDQKW